MKQKIFAMLLLGAVLLAGCSAGADGEKAAAASAAQPVTTGAPAAEADRREPVVDEATGKIKLILAGMRMDGAGWKQLAEDFNAQSDSYIVELKDYYTGDETSDLADLDQMYADVMDAKTRLNTELIAGKLPDMLAFDNLSPLPYIGKDLLLDLDLYLEADGTLSADKLLCWDALHEYGGLYILGQHFYVDTLACSQEFYAAHKGWTLADYLEIEKGMRDDQQIIYYMSQEEFLTQMGGRYLSRALDLEHGTCDFENAEFIGLLDAVRTAGQYELSEEVETPTAKQMQAGRLMCCAEWLDAPSQVAIDRNDGGQQLDYIGWPTVDGSCGSVVNLSGTISAFATTGSPEGCWAFIQYVVTHASDAAFAGFGSPLYRPLLQKAVGEWNADPLIAPEIRVTEEDLTVYLDAVNAAPAMAFTDESVMQIIQEECAPLLRGEGTAEDAARRIQSRASLYMTEQYG